MSYTLIERKELTSAASSISFDNIPQFYSDLLIKISGRTSGGATAVLIAFNGSTSSFSARVLLGVGSSAVSYTNAREAGTFNGLGDTANTFNNTDIYIPNYAGATNKSYSADSVTENNATSAYQSIVAGLWSNTAPITSLAISGASNLEAGSSISLYGINRQQAIGAPKAVGGQISFANGHWIHTFTGSGTFFSKQNLECEYLVVAGGGAGGTGGGGAGGLLTGNSQLPAGSHLVTVGAGGTRSSAGNGFSVGNTSGANSGFLNFTSTGGGRGANSGTGDSQAQRSGVAGGSGGGASFPDSGTGTYPGGTGISGQGNNGGFGQRLSNGGGGGAASVGQNANARGTNLGGNGGNGFTSNISGSAASYAGGGGGVSWTTPDSIGGIGGGGAGGNISGNNAANAVASTGGGGGGSWDGAPGNGGSGIVIIRYKA